MSSDNGLANATGEILTETISKQGDRHRSHMEKAFLAKKVKFTENFWADYWFYLCNNHVVLSICCNHRENPFSGCPRIIGLVASLLFALLSELSLAFGKSSENEKSILKWTLILVLQSVFDLEVQQLTSCVCMRSEGMPRLVRKCCAPILGGVMGCGVICILGLPTMIMAIIYVASPSVDSDESDALFEVFLRDKLASFGTAVFPMGLGLYMMMRCREKEVIGFEKKEPSGVVVVTAELEKV